MKRTLESIPIRCHACFKLQKRSMRTRSKEKTKLNIRIAKLSKFPRYFNIYVDFLRAAVQHKDTQQLRDQDKVEGSSSKLRSQFPDGKTLRKLWQAKLDKEKTSLSQKRGLHTSSLPRRQIAAARSHQASPSPDGARTVFKKLDHRPRQLQPIRVGDWIDCHRSASSHYSGLVVAAYPRQESWLLLEASGQLIAFNPRSTHFQISGFIAADLMPSLSAHALEKYARLSERLSVAEWMLSEEGIAFNEWDQDVSSADKPAWRDLLSKLRLAETRRANIARRAVQAGLADLYDYFKHEDPSESSILTPYAAAEILLPAMLTNSSAFTAEDFNDLAQAAFLYMLGDSARFVAPRDFATRDQFRLRPYKDLVDLLIVCEWQRQATDPYLSFIQKSQQILKTVSSQDSPDNALPTWDVNDQRIIRTLLSSFVLERTSQVSPYGALQLDVLNRLAQPESILSEHLEQITFEARLARLLARIGAIAPWQNLTTLGTAIERWDKVKPQPRSDLALGSLYHASDSMRVDWTSQTVYVIDSESAEELDDGISLQSAEPVDGRSTWWIRMHIADPTAVITPDSEIASLASQRMETLYLAEKTLPMLPANFLKANRLGLGSEQDKPYKVLTFSIRVDSHGSVLERTITPALVQKTVCTTYDAVDQMLGVIHHSNTSGVDISSIGIFPPSLGPPSSRSTIASEHLQDLKTLSELTLKISNHKSASSVQWYNRRAEVRRVVNPIESPPTDRPIFFTDVPHIIANVPGLNASLDDEKMAASLAMQMVSSLMVQAGITAADFGIAHRLPLPYVVQAAPASTGDAESLYRSNSKAGLLTTMQAMKLPRLSAAFLQTSPGPHWGLGIRDGGYTRATSPLRRFQDMLVHWQIKSALVNPKIGSDAEIMAKFKSLVPVASGYNRLTKRANLHWILWTLKLAHERFLAGKATEPEQQIFANLDAVISRPAAASRRDLLIHGRCQVPALGVEATYTLSDLTSSDIPEVGEIRPVRINSFQLGNAPLLVVDLK